MRLGHGQDNPALARHSDARQAGGTPN